MAKWLELYHPTRRIKTTILATDKAKLALYKRGGWRVGPLPSEAEFKAMAKKEASKSKKAKK